MLFKITMQWGQYTNKIMRLQQIIIYNHIHILIKKEQLLISKPIYI